MPITSVLDALADLTPWVLDRTPTGSSGMQRQRRQMAGELRALPHLPGREFLPCWSMWIVIIFQTERGLLSRAGGQWQDAQASLGRCGTQHTLF